MNTWIGREKGNDASGSCRPPELNYSGSRQWGLDVRQIIGLIISF